MRAPHLDDRSREATCTAEMKLGAAPPHPSTQAYTLLWSLWRNHGTALGVIWMVSIISLGSAACLVKNTSVYLDDTLYVGYAGILWVSGVILIFTENTTHGLQFSCPALRFTLPISTVSLTAMMVTYRVGITFLHTAICLFPLYLGDAFAPVAVGTFVLALALQWAAFLYTRYNALRALGEVLLILVICLYVVWSEMDSIVAPNLRASYALAIVAIPALLGCFRAARIARWGHEERWPLVHRRRYGKPLQRRKVVTFPGLNFPSSLWAQTWLEFRSTAVWFPVGLVTSALLVFSPIALTSTAYLEVSDISGFDSAGLALAFATGYLWEYRNRTTARFTLAVPQSDFKRSAARVLAGFCAVVAGYLGIAAILAGALWIRRQSGDPLMVTDDAKRFLVSLAIASAPVWWVVLSTGRILLLTVLPAILAFVILRSFFWESLLGNDVIPVMLMVMAATLFGLGLLGRWYAALPIPWALIAVPVLMLQLFQLEVEYPSYAPELSAPLTMVYVLPLAATLALFYWARRTRLLSTSAIVLLGAAAFLIFELLAWNLPIRAYNFGLIERDSAACVASGTVLPFIWYPILARFQRTG